MPALERSLETLTLDDPGALPSPVALALRATRRRRRAVFAGAVGAAVIPALVVALTVTRPRPTPGVALAQSDLAPTSMAALTRLNHHADPDRLILPAVTFQGTGGDALDPDSPVRSLN